MVSRRQWQLAVLSTVVSVALLAACGGGGSSSGGPTGPAGAPTTLGSFTRVVVFGDSLSDVGTYTPATSQAGNSTAPFYGGRFTTNVATAWPEQVAAVLGLLPITPHQVGFGDESAICPSADNSCTGYAQGGARVTDVNGIGHRITGANFVDENGSPIFPRTVVPGMLTEPDDSTDLPGALTVPMVTQVANHHRRFGNFSGSDDLVFVYGGTSDVLYVYQLYLDALPAALEAIRQRAITEGRPPPTSEEIESTLATFRSAFRDGIARTAASELASLIKNEIIAKGGRYVAVMNLPDLALTPFGRAQTLENRLFLTQLSEAFNASLQSGLSNVPVALIDAGAALAEFVNNYTDPAFGLENVDVPACDATKIATITSPRVTYGSSLFCNGTRATSDPFYGLRDGADMNTWLFADDLNLSAGGHALFATTVLATLERLNWIVP